MLSKLLILLATLLLVSFATTGVALATDIVVTPGHSGTNGDVSINNNSTSTGNGVISPSTPEASLSTVTLKSGFFGSVTGIDSNDTVSVRTNSNANLTCDGGTVSIQTGCSVTISAGTAPVTVTTPNGGAVIGAGSTVTLTT